MYFGVAYWFRRTHSRAASIILLLLAAALLYVATAEIPGGLQVVSADRRQGGHRGGGRGGGSPGRPSAAVDATGDLEILRQLKKAGSDLSKPHLPEFPFAFPNEAAAQPAVD